MAPRVGVVAIGRNEGERLERCLRSLPPGVPTVYVDSGSSDGSVARARESGAAVVDLDADSPFTAARARNAGFERLLADTPEIEFVQFVDGDCELRPDWLRAAAVHLSSHANVAAVCGRRRERHPDASPWNRLADLEWDTPVGDARAFGGDVLIRADVFRSVGGYDATRIAGEDPDLALRIRRAGHNVERLGLEMTLHDAALASVGAWWRRAVRGGHAYAEAFYHERAAADPDLRRHIASTLFWGGLIPLVALVLAPATGGASLVAFGAWVLLGVRIYRAMRRRGRAPRDAALSAGALVACKVAELQGALTFAWNRLVLRRHTRLIEYKQGP